MYARVVRFNDVTAERISEVVARIEEEGPPAGVDSTGIQVFADETKGTAVFVGYFETEQKMHAANAVFEEMNPSETPGIRASIDLCEVKLQHP
jgi:2'-5' RNA ligase